MASSISEAQAELISSLAPDDIPHKLRCAICSKLAVNAFRLPCCEQAICETCQSNLPQSCPVCEHSPLSADDCTPNKSLRTTIRVFLRTAEKKREATRPKEVVPAAPVEPQIQTLPEPELPSSEAVVDVHINGNGPSEEIAAHKPEDVVDDTPEAPKQDDAEQNCDASQVEDSTNAPTDAAAIQDDNQDTSVAPAELLPEGVDGAEPNSNDQEQYGTEGANGGFPNMMFPPSGDFNQMQMMMAMQNGMGSNNFNGFPMMGMPGMGMDPMQSMYMNGGFQGMGMNGMGGFGGGFGQGSNDNWNGSQSWNLDQNNYNQNAPGMGTGDFGNFNSGFQTGYNQGNYGQFNDYRRNNFGRGRGRGRGFYGGYGRGGYQQGGMTNYQDQSQYSQYGHGHGPSADSQSQTQTGAQGVYGGSVHADERSGSAQPEGGDNNGAQTMNTEAVEAGNSDPAKKDSTELASRESLGSEAGGYALHTTAAPPIGPSMAGNPHSRNGAGVIRSVLTVPDVPINAPKGPKAMRQGLPNTSLVNLRARGFQVGDSGTSAPKPSPIQQVNPTTQLESTSNSLNHDKEKNSDSQHDYSKERSKDSDKRDKAATDYDNQDREREKDRKRETGQSRSLSRASSKSQGRNRSKSRSRSRSRAHKSSHRRRRQRSETVDDEEKEKDDAYRRKRHRSRRHAHYDDDEPSRSKDDKPSERSRSVSPDESKRSSHRSRKERDYERRSGRDKDKDKDKEKYRDDDEDRQRSGHRSHRDRDYEHSSRRDKERDREKDRKERKERHKERDRDREHKHSSGSRKHSVDGTSTPGERSFDPPTGPRGFDSKTSSSRSHQDRSDMDRHNSHGSNGAQKDPHTLEREARNRERLLKEAQRMAGLAGSKRSRDDGDDGGGGSSRKGRRSSRRTDFVDGDEEERMRRLEAEREGGRWG